MRIRIASLIVAGLMFWLVGSAQEAEAPEPAAEDTPPPAEAEAGGAAAEREAAAEEDDFEFLEEIPAEEQLVFPVDI